MNLFFDKKALEIIRDIIRETMLGNVAIALLINISSSYMTTRDISSLVSLSVFILTIICIELWVIVSTINYLGLLQKIRKKLSIFILTLWMCLFFTLTSRYFVMLSDAWTNQ